jgi:flagella basal body P-ring formation protein FlgA
MNSRSVRILIFVFVLLCNLGFAAPAAAAVSLHTTIEVTRPTVRLSDVFDGVPEDVDCDIARAPAPGKSITYDSNVLAILVKRYNLDWKPKASDHATVTSIASRIENEEVQTAVVDKLKTIGVEGEIDVAFDNHALEVVLPGNQTPNFTLNNFTYDRVNKRFHADLVADGANGLVTVPLAGHVSVRHNVPVLVRRLEAGTLIGSSDIDWISLPDDRLAGVVTSAEDLVNHEVRRDTDAGVPLHQHDISPQRYVIRGNLVTMKIETPFMTVTAQGRALQDGKLGDTVRIQNTQSNRTIEGTVEAVGVVRVRTTRILAEAEAAAARQE